MQLTRQIVAFSIMFIAALSLVVACGGGQDGHDHASGNNEAGHSHDDDHTHAEGDHDATSILAGLNDAICVVAPTDGNTARGEVRFHQGDDGRVRISGTFSGLSANAEHAIHIHEFGDVTSADGTATGGHYNPEGHAHGLPGATERHAGDFGNLKTDADGNATVEFTADDLSIAGKRNPVVGRSIIVHALPDDGGQPTGNAGARIAQGVIGIAKAD